MSIKIKQSVDTNSTEFADGVEAGLKSKEDTKNWKAGHKLGQALKEESETEKEEGKTEAPIYENPGNEHPTPLFLRDSSDGRMGNAQDEKDETKE
jgi:hypothetical protein